MKVGLDEGKAACRLIAPSTDYGTPLQRSNLRKKSSAVFLGFWEVPMIATEGVCVRLAELLADSQQHQ
jgi:hypothetical protein